MSVKNILNLEVSGREFHTILAALRYYPRYDSSDVWLNSIATNCGEVVPLSAEEIDALCERLNHHSGSD